GARGLRAIVEETLLDVMFEVPSRTEIAQVVVNSDSIRHHKPVRLVPKAKLVSSQPQARAA
ncbi:MAG: ATP-dependent Clp protease ATP-binding subunit ClpX, partial [Propionibacteriaceae bacterium]|nr:ATP-dependent Clp protease ATP-binding subunit ClpX [Propionibacteriaceae bacterium]